VSMAAVAVQLKMIQGAQSLALSSNRAGLEETDWLVLVALEPRAQPLLTAEPLLTASWGR
jgi:hypothetical protein